jgi:hypothetical protein
MATAQAGGATVTVKLHVAAPLASVAVLVTVVVPTGNTLPEGGIDVTNGVPPHESLAVTSKKTAVGTEDVTLRAAGHSIETQLVGGVGGVTDTMKLPEAVPPHVSVAVTLTVVTPTGKVLPLGGVAVTTGTLQPPPAVRLKKTTAPFVPEAWTVRFAGIARSITTTLFVGGGIWVIEAGWLVMGDQVWPPSRLTSVKMSKKLLIR